MLTTFHANTGYHAEQFHGKTVGSHQDNILATIKGFAKNRSQSFNFEHHETIRIKENLDA